MTCLLAVALTAVLMVPVFLTACLVAFVVDAAVQSRRAK